MNASFKRPYVSQANGVLHEAHKDSVSKDNPGRDGHGRDAHGRDAHGRDAHGRDSRARESHRTVNALASESKLRDIAQSLDIMVTELQLLAERSEEGVMLTPIPASNVERAKQVYRNRRRREQVFGDASLFGEPAWDIMLDLYVAAAQDKRIAVTSACIGSAVPATTALRWIKILEDRGLIEREVDEVDARRTFVRLSPRGCDLMEEYLAG